MNESKSEMEALGELVAMLRCSYILYSTIEPLDEKCAEWRKTFQSKSDAAWDKAYACALERDLPPGPLREILEVSLAAKKLYPSIEPGQTIFPLGPDLEKRNRAAWDAAKALEPPAPEWAKEILNSRAAARLDAVDHGTVEEAYAARKG